MRIHYTQIEKVVQGEDLSYLLPCLPGTDIAAVLDTLGVGNSGSLARITHDLQAMGSEDTMTVFSNNTRIEIVNVKTNGYGAVCAAMQSFSAKFKKKRSHHWVLYTAHLEAPSAQEGALNGLLIGLYQPGLYKTDNGKNVDPELSVISNLPDIEAIGKRASDAAATQKKILKLVNTPSNHKEPQHLADWAVESGKEHHYSVTVLDENMLAEQGFQGLLSVNRGSEYPARFIICDYHPEGAKKTVALVGKGVTFDTGGISIKPSSNMHYMKSDMGGAAAVLGAVELAAKQHLPVRVLAFVPATDNSVDARAIKPGDVIASYSGQTIEVLNTDAEGRLILADALAYAIRHYSPDVIIDLATLTGSVVRALGSHCAGLFTHNDALAAALMSAGDQVGERLWRLPLWDVYADEMRSDIADIKNISDKPVAGSITAAKFLEHFVEEHPAWAHIDIAGTAFNGNGTSRSYSATAYGVRLLFEYLHQSQA